MSVSSLALADRHRHATPVRVGAVHGGLDERRVDDRLGHPLGLGRGRGRRRRRPRSASRRPRRRGRSAWSATRRPSPSAASSSSASTGPAAPLARTTAVSLVDVSVSMLTQLNVRSTTRRNARVELGRVDLGVGEQHGDHRRHVGLDHPDALGDADDPRRPVADRRRGDLGHGVGGHDARAAAVGRRRPPAAAASPRRRRGCGPSGSAGRSRRSRRRARRPASQPRRVGDAVDELVGVGEAGRAVGDVGVLGHDDDRLRAGRRRGAARLIVTLGPANRLRVNTPAAGTRPLGGDHDEVVGVVLDADVGDVAAEAARAARSSARLGASSSAGADGSRRCRPSPRCRRARGGR